MGMLIANILLVLVEIGTAIFLTFLVFENWHKTMQFFLLILLAPFYVAYLVVSKTITLLTED